MDNIGLFKSLYLWRCNSSNGMYYFCHCSFLLSILSAYSIYCFHSYLCWSEPKAKEIINPQLQLKIKRILYFHTLIGRFSAISAGCGAPYSCHPWIFCSVISDVIFHQLRCWRYFKASNWIHSSVWTRYLWRLNCILEDMVIHQHLRSNWEFFYYSPCNEMHFYTDFHLSLSLSLKLGSFSRRYLKIKTPWFWKHVKLWWFFQVIWANYCFIFPAKSCYTLLYHPYYASFPGVPISALDGVPIAIKDEIDCLPYPTTGNLRFRFSVDRTIHVRQHSYCMHYNHGLFSSNLSNSFTIS